MYNIIIHSGYICPVQDTLSLILGTNPLDSMMVILLHVIMVHTNAIVWHTNHVSYIHSVYIYICPVLDTLYV